jgi:hypothetical protein
MISKYINVPIFIASLVIGLLIVWFTMQNDLRKIYVYPTPENVDVLQYRDKAGNCFSYKQLDTPCPKNESKLAKIPVQL